MKNVHGFLESDRVHGSIYIPVVRLHDLQHARTEPFHGFAVGDAPPNWAMPRAFAMSSLTVGGKFKKLRLDDPTQCNGFSSAAGTRLTYANIPVLG